MNKAAAKCCHSIYGRLQFRGVPCSKKATVRREGKWYCTIHDPVRREEKRKARDEKWERERQANREKMQLQSAAPDLLAALKELAEYMGPMCEDDDRDYERKILALARAAIAKATGAQP